MSEHHVSEYRSRGLRAAGAYLVLLRQISRREACRFESGLGYQPD